MRLLSRIALVIIVVGALGTTGCSWYGQRSESGYKDVSAAVAVLHPTEGNAASGQVYFIKTGNGVKVVVDMQGLAPNSTHGFHIHQYGDCTAADGTSAGGHYAPQGHKHGAPTDAEHHAGDLGNIEADGHGRVHHEMTVDFISIAGRHNPILGRGVIVHAHADDLTSQPSGDAGARIACGVIGVANPKDVPGVMMH